VALVKDGYLVGLGSGRTMALAVEALARRVMGEGLRVRVVPTSYQIEMLAVERGLPLAGLDAPPDIAIDGADQVEEGTLDMIKGGGGALMREKVVDSFAKELVVVVDEEKLTPRLGRGQAVPVEILNFGYRATLRRIAGLGGRPVLRQGSGKLGPVVTDNGNFIADVDFGGICDARGLDDRLKRLPGVLETGLFLGLASAVYVGAKDGSVRLLKR